MEEIFKDIPNYKGLYQVSNYGNVKSLSKISNNRFGEYLTKEIILRPCINQHGYLQVVLQKNRNKKTIRVHQLVAMAFLNHKPDGHKLVVDHINHVKTDNRIENLQLISNRRNISKDKYRKEPVSRLVGVSKNGTKRWRSKICINRKQIHLGYFNTEIEARKAYINKLEEING